MTDGFSAADFAALTNNDGFSNNGAWWIIILFLFAFNGGWGNGGTQQGYTLASDFSNIERKIDGVNNGLCDGFYAQNTSLLNGFSGLQQTNAVNTANLTSAITNGFNQQNLTNLQNANALNAAITGIGNQMQSCCCNIERGIDGVNYNMQTQTNALQTSIANSTRDIIANDNSNYQRLHDEIVENKMELLKQQICDQKSEIDSLNLAASQAAQSAYIINSLKTTGTTTS